MSSYCRITGKSRGLPKPNYFPLLPPISPADAKRLCRITGKSYGLPSHHYIPVLVGLTRHSKSIAAKADVTAVEHHVAVGIKHTILKDYRYVFPVLESNADLVQMLESKSSSEIDNNNKYVYTVNERRCSLVFPGRLEAAVRDGDVRDIMLATHTDTLLLKLRKGGSVEVDVRDMSFDESQELFEGEGPSQEVLQRRRKRAKNRGDNNDWRRKIFEDKERQADYEEERISEIKSKRIKVKLDAIKETPHLCSWNNVREGLIELHADPEFDLTIGNSILKFSQQDLQNFINVPGSPIISTLPQCLKVQPENVDLSVSIPGIIKQPIATGEHVIGFPIGAVIVPFQPLIIMTDEAIDNEIQKFNISKDKLQKILIKQLDLQTQFGNTLPLIQQVPDLAKQIETLIGTENEIKTEFGVKLNLENGTKYIPGQFFHTPSGPVFVPGNVIETPMGPSFVAGFSVNTPEGIKFLPGRIVKDHEQSVFISGQMAVTREGEKFVQGQMVCTKEGPKFIPGQTVITPEGVKFVPGQVIQNTDDHSCRFIPGQTIMTPEGPQFISGQFTQSNEETVFVPGQAVLNENYNWEFIPGKNLKTEDGTCIFVPGKDIVSEFGASQFVPGRIIIENGEVERFLPGLTVDDGTGNMRFVPGMQLETPDGIKFVEGMMIKNENSVSFAVGKISPTGVDGTTIEFSTAKCEEDVVIHDILSNFGMCFGSTLAAEGINETEVFGHMIQSAQGVEFFPGDTSGLPAGKVIPGKLIKGKEMRFIPGTMIDNKFIPGQFVTTGSEEKFIPGQVIETNEGPKFVPGQVLHTKSGPKFVPGQMMETEDGPKFIPGQIIETKSGPTFIPGQVIYTEEEGSRFVPGQVVDTIEGPRFVPGRVIETGDHVTFIPGQIVETEDGLKFIAPDLEDDLEGGYQFTVQGFEVAQEELKMIQRNSIPYACFYGEMAIDSQTLQQLAQAGMAVGRQLPVDVPVVNIKSMPTTEAACKIANNLDVDALYSVKLSHILSSLQQVCHSNVALTNEEMNDKNLLELVKLAMECESNANFLETLGNALEQLIKEDSCDKLKTIDNLHKSSIELATKLRDKKPNKLLILKNLAKGNIDEKHEVVSSMIALLNDHQPAVLASFQQMCQQNPEFVDKVLENVALMMKNVMDTNDETSAVETLQRAIVKTVIETSQSRSQQASHHNKEDEGSQLVVQESNDVQLLVKACEIADKLKVNATCSAKLGQILSNLELARQSNVTLTREEVGNEDLLKLFNLALKCNSKSDLLETLGGVLENIINQNTGNELEIINCLQTSSAKMATNAHKKQIKMKARQIANNLQVDATSSAKLGHILLDLHQTCQSHVALTNDEVGNEDLSSLLNLALNCDTNSNLLETLSGALEEIIKRDPSNKQELINHLQKSAAKMVIKASNKKAKAKGNLQLLTKACQIADNLQVNATCSAKLGHILSNLEKVCQSNVVLTSDEVGDENVFRLLNLAMNCDTNSDIMEVLGGALEDVLKQNPSCKEEIIDHLQTSTSKMATKAQYKQQENKACQLARKLQVDASSMVKLDQILSDLEHIRQCSVSLTMEEVGDEDVSRLLNFVMKCDTKSDLLETLPDALEEVIKRNPSNKQEVINYLQASLAKMAIIACNKKLKENGNLLLLDKTCQIADKLQVDVTSSLKLGHILSNLEQVRQFNVELTNEEVGDVKILKLLNLALKCDTNSDLLETLGDALEEVINKDSGNKVEVIDFLQTSTAKMAIKARNKKARSKCHLQLLTKASQIANKLHLDSACSIKLGQIFSNLEQIRQAGVAVTSKEVEDENVLRLLNLALKCDTNSNLLETVSGALEDFIKKAPGNKAEVIDWLQTSTAKLATKVHEMQLEIKSCQIADELQVDDTYSVKICQILSSLQEIHLSDVCITSKDVTDKNVLQLLNLAKKCDTNSDLLETLGDALVNIIKENSGNELNVIDCLQTFSSKLANQIRHKKVLQNKDLQLLAKACQVADELKVDLSSSVKLGHILSNMLEVCQAEVELTNSEVGDENLVKLLNLAKKCETNSDLLETLTFALGDVIKQESGNVLEVIDSLKISAAKLVAKTRKKSGKENNDLQILAKSCQVADRLKVNSTCSVQLGHILSNLQEVCLSNVSLTTEEIGDKNMLNLLNLAMECDTNTNLLENLANVLSDVIKQSPGDAVEMINCLQTSAAKMVVKARNKKAEIRSEVQMLAKACEVVNNLQVDVKCSIEVGNILSNLEKVRLSNVAFTREDVDNEDVLRLLNLAVKCDTTSDLLEKLSRVLEDVIKKDPGNKFEVINSLQACTAEMTIKANNKQLKMQACQVADKLQVDSTFSTKLGDILSNLQEVCLSNVPLLKEEVRDERLLKLLNLGINCDTKADFLETLADALGDVIKQDSGNVLEVIDYLHTSAAKMVVKARNKKFKSKADVQLLIKSCQISDKLQVDSAYSVKLGQILSNLEKACQSNVALTSEDIENENVFKLLNLAMKCDTNSDLLETLTDALVDTIRGDSGNTLDVIECLLTSSVKVANKAQKKQLKIKAGQIANKLQVDEVCSAKLGHILSNLQQICQSNVTLTKEEFGDELWSLVNLAINCDSHSDLVESLAEVLENVINQDCGNKSDVIDYLQKSTTKMATAVLNKKVKEKRDLQRRVKACQIADSLQVNATCSPKLGNILANLQQVCQSKVTLTSEEIGDEKILQLLNLVMKCNTDSDVLETLADALEDIIKQDPDNASDVIDCLQTSATKVASKAHEKTVKANNDLQLLVKGCQVADKLKVDAPSSVKLCNILSNLQQIRQSNVALTSEEVGDKELFNLLNLAMNCDTNSDLLETLADALEVVIKRDSGNKLDVIDCLQTSTAKLASKARSKKPSKVLLLRNLINGGSMEEKNIVMNKLVALLNDHETTVGIAFQHMCQQDPKFVDKVLENAAIMLKTIVDPEDETAAMETLHRAIIKAVTECSESKVHQAMRSKGGDDFHLLIKDAISLAKALGMCEVVSILNEVLKDRNSIQVLAKDTIVMEVLKRLTVMRQLAESRPNLVRALKDLHSDPYAARSDPRLRELVRESAMLMVIPEESLIKSSADIPHSIMFSDNCLVVEDFMAKTRQCGNTFLILKKGIQAVIPREAAKDVLTGRVPYTMLDENGIHYFKPLHVFNALKLPRVATNRFHNYTYIHPALLDDDSSSGTRGSSVSMEDLRKSLPNGHGHSPNRQEVNFRVRIGLK